VSLSLRELNRAYLARQFLLERAPHPPLEAVRHLVGLQAQVINPPYLGLWTRLAGFELADLTTLIEARQVVRATMFRATLHLVETEDYLRWRLLLMPATARAMRGFMGRRIDGLDGERLAAVTRDILLAAPVTYGRIGALLAEHFPGFDEAALGYAAFRHHLPIVQVPPGGTWGSRPADQTYQAAADLLGRPLEPGADAAGLVRRYLAAFGPASAADVQRWSGLTGLAATVRAMPDLVRLPGPAGELLDLADAPRPPGDTPAPPRFIPDYDNLILGHADRTRVIADADRKRVFVSGGGRVLGTVLVDGFVAGTWKVERPTRKRATLVVTPFRDLAGADRDALAAEGEALLAFAAPGAVPAISFGT
jgi:DNA glycosylase AlkZ-like